MASAALNQPKAFINRKDYAVTRNAAVEDGGGLVSDKITLEFEGSPIKTA
jgi:hypothetical protein